jgi:uncharacterized membrane protein
VTTASIAIGAVLVLVMVGISAYGAVTLPSDARIPIHYGIGSYNNFVSKTVGLIIWPVGGAVIYGIFVAVSEHAIKPNHGSRGPGQFILLAVLVLIVVFQFGAISLARGGSTTARSE